MCDRERSGIIQAVTDHKDFLARLVELFQTLGLVLLIDYKMPRVDGLEVVRRLRGKKDKTPAIMITGYYSETLRNKALSAGFSDILEKPALPNSLVEMIQKTVN
jgi:CheY-like chemotaxis protein